MSGFLSDIGGAVGDIASMFGDRGWLARLRRASFRGASFLVEDSHYTVGRRLAQHEFPQRDIPFSEDLGRKQQAIGFGAYLIGDNCDAQAARLRKACEQAGPGTLVHPALGSVQVTCESANFSTRRDLGRIVTVTLDFFEAGQISTTKTDSTSDVADKAAGSLTDASTSSFSSMFSLEGAANFVGGSAVQDVRTFCDQISAIRIPGLEDQSSLLKSLDTLFDRAPQLVQDAGDLTQATQSVFQTYTDTSTAEAGYGGMISTALAYGKQATDFVGTHGLSFFNALATPPVPTGAAITRDRQAEHRNHLAWRLFVECSALVEVVYNAPGLELGSADDAIVVRDQINEAFEQALIDAADAEQDDLFTALIDARDALLSDIDERIVQLPALVIYRTPDITNSLVLAWRLYADANRSDELVARANAITPAFMPITGRVLER